MHSTILPLLFTAGISSQYCYRLPNVFELYSIKLYNGITISISLALFTSVLFILLMQLCLNITFSLALFPAALSATVFRTVIFPVTSIYGSL